jgi:arsenate reductase (thioredoxin)
MESCRSQMAQVKHRLHMGFEDPSKATGTSEFILLSAIAYRFMLKNLINLRI